MRRASVEELKSRLSTYLKSANENGPVVVTRNGRPVALLVGMQDEEEMERLLMGHSPQLQAILERSRQQFRDGQWLSEDAFWARLESQPTKTPAKAKRKRASRAG